MYHNLNKSVLCDKQITNVLVNFSMYTAVWAGHKKDYAEPVAIPARISINKRQSINL